MRGVVVAVSKATLRLTGWIAGSGRGEAGGTDERRAVRVVWPACDARGLLAGQNSG